MTAQVAVVTDSAASLDAAIAARTGIRVVPLRVIVGDRDLAEGIDVSPDEIVTLLEARSRVSTSQPSPEAFATAYRKAVDAGAQAIIAVTLSRALSGSYVAAGAGTSDAAVPVTVVDSRTVALAQGLAALVGAAHARAGADAVAVAHAVRAAAESSACVFTVDSLEPLRRGGRLSGPAAALGSALSMRPILVVEDGEIAVASRVRTTRRAREAVLARIADECGRMRAPVAAVQGLDPVVVDEAAARLRALVPGVTVLTGSVGAVLAAHTGVGVLAAVAVDAPDLDVGDFAPTVPGSVD